MNVTNSQYVVDYELSKKLENARIFKKSIFFWEYQEGGYWAIRYSERDLNPQGLWVKAYNITELLEMLPHEIKGYEIRLGYYYKDRTYSINWINDLSAGRRILIDAYMQPPMLIDSHLPNVLATALLHLIENKIIEVPK